jgi:hypothetical protein
MILRFDIRSAMSNQSLLVFGCIMEIPDDLLDLKSQTTNPPSLSTYTINTNTHRFLEYHQPLIEK